MDCHSAWDQSRLATSQGIKAICKRSKHLSPHVQRYRFTIAATALLLGFAIASDSCWHALDDTWRDWLGFAPTNLLDFKWQRFLTSLLLTAGGWKFMASILMLILCAGMTERLYGTFATMKLFLTCHLTVLAGLSVALLLVATFNSSPSILALTNGHDVGPSAGYYGCLGAILMWLPLLRRRSAFLCVLSILLIRLIISVGHLPEGATVVSADVAHLLALPLGASLTWLGYIVPCAEAKTLRPSLPSD
jgi:membrane associated rhomboid family serine protease